jgi:hypothetical protein
MLSQYLCHHIITGLQDISLYPENCIYDNILFLLLFLLIKSKGYQISIMGEQITDLSGKKSAQNIVHACTIKCAKNCFSVRDTNKR